MSKLSELLAAKAGTVPKPQPAIPSKVPENSAENQATGMSGSISGIQRIPQYVPPALPDDADYDKEKAATAKGVFKDNGRFSRYFKYNGTKVNSENGFFYPETTEDFEILSGVVARGSVTQVA